MEAEGTGRGVAGHAGEAARDGGRAAGQPAGGLAIQEAIQTIRTSRH